MKKLNDKDIKIIRKHINPKTLDLTPMLSEVYHSLSKAGKEEWDDIVADIDEVDRMCTQRQDNYNYNNYGV